MSNNEQLIQGRPFIVHLTPFSSKNVFSVFRAFLFRYPLRFLFRVLSTPLFERDLFDEVRHFDWKFKRFTKN